MSATDDVHAAYTGAYDAAGQASEHSGTACASCTRCATSHRSSAWLATTADQEPSR